MELPLGVVRARALALWNGVRSSYWFAPAVMVAAALAAAAATLALDRLLADRLAEGPAWLTALGPETARSVLSTIATAMLSVAALVFSVVIVAFSLAATQFGPRLVAHFMRDTGVQLSLGAFVAAFLFCVVVLRAMTGKGDRVFVPQLSVLAAMAGAAACIGMLIFFFHHAARLMQAGEVVAQAGRWLERVMAREYLESEEDEADRTDEEAHDPDRALPPSFEENARAIRARDTGYLAGVDAGALVEIAERHDLVLRAEASRGDFVVPGIVLLRADPAARAGGEVERELYRAWTLVDQRADAGDAELAVDRLVQIGLRAMSPAINDPFTAMECVDRLAGGLARAAAAHRPDARHRDRDGRLRLILPPPRRHRLLDHAFHQLRHFGRANLPLLLRILDALRLIASRAGAGDPELTDAIRRHAEMVREIGDAELVFEWERKRLRERYEQVLAAVR